ncbi:hypothetical protein C8F04DRAFT_1260933 [Mycena alexandri]|uniref:Uncharacterized protein n=1 Tax=Mycena alexandri TaxID=1745969 RepID=A0AAD6WZM0_9AGAR|nr:hypothetical protein C8F04DRAFT_1260933 [Mycena alexandri]
MPLEITTRTIAMSETKPDTGRRSVPGLSVKLPYVPIYQGGYGRMDRSTPAQGLATSRVASFTPIVDWVIGGDGKTDWSHLEGVAWLSGAGAKTAGVSVEAVADFRRFLDSAAASRSFRVASCLDAPELLKCGAVLVDKVTARITYLALKGGRESWIDVENLGLANQYTMAQQQQDLFVAHVMQERQLADAAQLHLQYDVSLYGRAMPLPDEARLLLRLKPATAAAQSLLLRTLKVSNDWISGPGLQMGSTKRMLNRNCAGGTPLRTV